jgi:hypothetical protein
MSQNMNRDILPLPRYDGLLFTWSKAHGTIEASDLGLPVGAMPGARVWADACDIGMIVEGEREDKLFLLEEHDTDEGWTFVSVDGKHRVTVWND